MTWRRVAALLLPFALLCCAGADPAAPPPETKRLPEAARVADVRLVLGEGLGAQERSTLERLDVASLVRLAALDWFEHEHRFDPEGGIEIEVEVLSLTLVGAVPTWLWRSLAGGDALEVRVRVRDRSGPQSEFVLTERTAVAGWEWRNPDDRLDRMARRLGRRIAELL